MGRERMVTRTVVEVYANILYVDLEKQTVGNKHWSIPEWVKPEKRLDYVQDNFMPTGFKAVSILDTERRETLYGMPESKFISEAEILPPRFTQKEDE